MNKIKKYKIITETRKKEEILIKNGMYSRLERHAFLNLLSHVSMLVEFTEDGTCV